MARDRLDTLTGDTTDGNWKAVTGTDVGSKRALDVNIAGGSVTIEGDVVIDAVTIENGAGAAAVNIQDGGNSITVDGAVTVSATNLDIRDLSSASDSIAAVQSGTWTVSVSEPVSVDDNGGSLTVDASNLDIRDLSFASDTVDVSGSTLGANSGTDIGDVTINNGSGGSAVNIQDGGNSITVDGSVSISGTVDTELTTADLDTGAGTDTRAVVGLVGSASGGGQLIPGSSTDGLLVNLGSNNDVTVTGSVTADTELPSATTLADDLTPGSAPYLGSLMYGYVSADSNWDRWRMTGDNADSIGTASTGHMQVLSHLMGYNGTTWDRLRSTIADGLLVNLGSNNDVTVTGTVTVQDGGNVISVDDAGGSITVDGAVTVSATNLDIRDLSAASDSVAVHGDVGILDQLDLTNSNPAAVAIVDSNGDQITSFGGGTQYTEGDIDASITGTAMMMEVGSNTLQPVQGTVADGLLVNLGSNNDVTVTGSVTANAGTNLNTSALALESGGNLAAAAASLSVIDDWDETDRAKVNLIVGQAGVQGGSGAVSATTQRVVLATDVALPTGSNVIGAVTQSGTWNIGTVTTVSAVTAISNALPAGTNNIGQVVPAASATLGGLTQHKTDALVATAVAVKASAGQVYGYHISNQSDADAYVQFYNIAQGSVTVGTSTRTRTLFIPQGGVIDTALPFGLTFSTAITIAATTTITGNTAPSTGLLVMIDYV